MLHPVKATINRVLFLFLAAFSLAVGTLFYLYRWAPDPSSLVGGTLDRFSTAMMATSVVSLVVLISEYWRLQGKFKVDWVPPEAEIG